MTGLFGIVMLGGDKVTSGILLIVSAIVMLVPIGRDRVVHRRIRIGLVCLVFCLVAWNISTTQIPSPHERPVVRLHAQGSPTFKEPASG